MTREDINDIINAICPNDEDYEKPCISPKYLRQELEQLALDQKQWNEDSTTKNDLGVDAISRADVLKLMQDNWHTHNGDWAMQESMDDIRALQAVTPIRPKGHWIIKDGKEQGYDIGGVKTWYIQIMCSECGFIKTAIEGHTGQYHYCPNCGADMREVEE